MAKTDFKADQPELYRPSAKTFGIVNVPPMAFLMVEDSPAVRKALDGMTPVRCLDLRLGRPPRDDPSWSLPAPNAGIPTRWLAPRPARHL